MLVQLPENPQDTLGAAVRRLELHYLQRRQPPECLALAGLEEKCRYLNYATAPKPSLICQSLTAVRRLLPQNASSVS